MPDGLDLCGSSSQLGSQVKADHVVVAAADTRRPESAPSPRSSIRASRRLRSTAYRNRYPWTPDAPTGDGVRDPARDLRGGLADRRPHQPPHQPELPTPAQPADQRGGHPGERRQLRFRARGCWRAAASCRGAQGQVTGVDGDPVPGGSSSRNSAESQVVRLREKRKPGWSPLPRDDEVTLDRHLGAGVGPEPPEHVLDSSRIWR